MNNADLTQLDLQNLSPEEQAELARQQQAALAAQQHHALLGLLSASPELQKVGELEYGQAGRERAGGQQTAGNVLRQALAQKELGLRGAQFQFEKEKFGKEFPLMEAREKRETVAPFLKSIIEGEADIRKIQAVASILGPSFQAFATKYLGAAAAGQRDAAIAAAKSAFGVDLTPYYGAVGGVTPKKTTDIDALRERALKRMGQTNK